MSLFIDTKLASENSVKNQCLQFEGLTRGLVLIISHDNVICALDREKKILHKLENLKPDAQETYDYWVKIHANNFSEIKEYWDEYGLRMAYEEIMLDVWMSKKALIEDRKKR